MKTVLIRFLSINSTVNLRSLARSLVARWGVSGSRAPCLCTSGGFMLGGIKSLLLPCRGGEAACLLFPFCFTSFFFFYLILEEASEMDIVQWCPGLESGCTLYHLCTDSGSHPTLLSPSKVSLVAAEPAWAGSSKTLSRMLGSNLCVLVCVFTSCRNLKSCSAVG